MINVLAIGNYCSIKSLVIPLKGLNLSTEANGCSKSNLYRALHLLAETAQGGIVAPLAREGGLGSAFWAGSETITRGMFSGDQPIQGGRCSEPVRLKLGFSGDDFGYAAMLGLPPPGPTAFALDPEFKQEAIWAGLFLRKANLLVDRAGTVVRRRLARDWGRAHRSCTMTAATLPQPFRPYARSAISPHWMRPSMTPFQAHGLAST